MSAPVPGVICPPWCQSQPHTDPDDISHMGPECMVELSEEPRIEMAQNSMVPDWLSVYLTRTGDGYPHVHLGLNQEIGVKLTLHEVRELAAVLTILATAGEAG